MGIDDRVKRVIVRDKTLITCDNENCEVYGDMWWCYLNQERNCGIYREWEQKLIRKSLEKYEKK